MNNVITTRTVYIIGEAEFASEEEARQYAAEADVRAEAREFAAGHHPEADADTPTGARILNRTANIVAAWERWQAERPIGADELNSIFPLSPKPPEAAE